MIIIPGVAAADIAVLIQETGEPLTLTNGRKLVAIREKSDDLPDSFGTDDGFDEVYNPSILWHLAGSTLPLFKPRDEVKNTQGEKYRIKLITPEYTGGMNPVALQVTLTTRLLSAFESLVDIWSVGFSVNSLTGEPSNDLVALVSSGVACHYDYTPNLSATTGIGRVKVQNFFTNDTLYFKAGTRIEDGWLVVNRTPGSANFNEVHRALGDKHPERARDLRTTTRKSVLSTTEEHPPIEIVQAYGL